MRRRRYLKKAKKSEVWKGMKPLEFKGKLVMVRVLKDGSVQLLLTLSPGAKR